MPNDIQEQDFHPYTCGLSTFVRKDKQDVQANVREWSPYSPLPVVEWREGRGIGGPWALTVDGDCSFLKDGEERGW